MSGDNGFTRSERSRWHVVLWALACVALLAACAPGSTPTPVPPTEPSVTAAPSPSPTAAEPDASPTTATPSPKPALAHLEEVVGAAEAAHPGVIVFAGRTQDQIALMAVAADGQHVARITDLGGFSAHPLWMPNAENILFTFYDPETDEIDLGLLQVSDGRPFTLTSDGRAAYWSDYAWSPSSRYLAYSAPQADGSELDIYRLDMSTGDTVNLTGDCSVWDKGPCWSPDGAMIAFTSDRLDVGCGGKLSDCIWIMAADGSEPRNLTNSHAAFWEDTNPSWSPDGADIAFYRFPGLPDEHPIGTGLWVVDVESGDERLLSEDESFIPVRERPAWSPDGTRVAFVKGKAGETDVWVVSRDGSGEIRLAELPGEESSISWAPDGKALVFTNETEETMTAYIWTEEDGARPLVEEANWSAYPNWSP